MADTKITKETTETKTETTEISLVAPPSDETVTSVTEKLTVKKSDVPIPAPKTSSLTITSTSKMSTVSEAPAPEPRPSASQTMPSPKNTKSSSDYSGYKTSSKRQTFREYTDTNRLLDDLCRDYRGTSPAVLESIATHPALYSKQYMPDRYRPNMSARSRKVIRDAEDLALVTPGLKHMLEVQYQMWLCLYVCMLGFGVTCAILNARALSFCNMLYATVNVVQ